MIDSEPNAGEQEGPKVNKQRRSKSNAETNGHAEANGQRFTDETGTQGNGHSADDSGMEGLGRAVAPYGIEWWKRQTFPPIDYVLGSWLSTTSRGMLVGPTGLGKTMLGLAMAWAIGAGKPFLHWPGCGRRRRVLYIDSEMYPTTMWERIQDASRRLGEEPETISIVSKMMADFPPLNTPEGQRFMDGLIAHVEAEFVMFDNIRYLLTGDIAKPETWAGVSKWVLELTGRNIGQLWLHHTGWNTGHGYGDSSKEWNFDTVMLMKALKPEPNTLQFDLEFTKCRMSKPGTAHEYADTTVTLKDDRWRSTVVSRTPKAQQTVLDVLDVHGRPMGRTELEQATSLKHTTFERAMKVLHVSGQVFQTEAGLWEKTATS